LATYWNLSQNPDDLEYINELEIWWIWVIFFHQKSFVYAKTIFFRFKFGKILPK
jgi:hypothetical protein